MPELQTLNRKTGQPQKSRIGYAGNAYDFVDSMLDSDQLRSRNRAKIDGMFDGLAPESIAGRNNKGRQNSINVNFRQATAIFNQVRAPYFDLLCEIPVLAIPRLSVGSYKERTQWAEIMAQGFTRMVTGWRKWPYISQQHQNIMIKHGIGFCYWPDEWDWRPDAGNACDILVPDGSPSNIEEIDVIAILKGYTANEVYQFIKNPKEAADLGWDIAATRQAIITAYNGGDNPPKGQQSWEWYEAKIKEADIYAGNYLFDRVFCAHVLVREFNGKISHNIIRYDVNMGEFLFQKIDRFDHMGQAVCPFFYDIGTGAWHSVNGLGKELYPHIQIMNKSRCQWLQASTIAGSAILQPENAQAEYIGGMHTFDGMTIMPPNWKMVEHSIGTNLQAIQGIIGNTEQTLINNVGSMMKAPSAPQPRKGQKISIMEMQQQGQLSKTNINRYQATCDALFTEIGRRAAKSKPTYPGGAEAQRWKLWCVARGVPIEAFDYIEDWQMYRSIGAGSASNEQTKIDRMMELLPMYRTEGQDEVMRLITARTVGTDLTNAICGNPEEIEQKENNDSIANLENSALREGHEQVISPGQDDVIHIDSHENDIEKHLQESEDAAKQAGGHTPEILHPVLVHLQVGLPHIKAHLDRIKNNPIKEKDYKRQNALFNELVQIAKQVKANFEQAAEAQAKQAPPQPGPNPELLSNIPYKETTESGRMAMEQAAGLPPRQPGEASIAEQNAQLKAENLRLKADKEQMMKVKTDVDLSQQTEAHRKEMATV